MLILHIIIALAGLIFSALNLIKPSKNLAKISAGLVAMTLVSGTTLAILTNSSITAACLSGIAYLTVTTLIIYLGVHRLASARIKA